jgi:hypothetical protein
MIWRLLGNIIGKKEIKKIYTKILPGSGPQLSLLIALVFTTLESTKTELVLENFDKCLT